MDERGSSGAGRQHSGSALRDFVAVIVRGLLPALLLGSVAAALTYFVSLRLEAQYRSVATLLISDARPSNQFGVTLLTAPVLAPSAYQAAFLSSVVLDAALERLPDAFRGDLTREDLADMSGMIIEVDNPSTLIRVWAEDPSPERASHVANALSDSLRDWDLQRARSNADSMIAALEANILALDAQLQRALSDSAGDQLTIGILRDQRADSMVSLETARALRSSAVGYVEQLEPAQIPVEAIFPRPVRSAALAFGLGVVLAYVLTLTRLTLDTRFRDSEDITETLGLPVIAEFMKAPGRKLPVEPANVLRANVLSHLADSHPKIILVSSARTGEGKTSVAISLAESLVRSSYRTILIDADLRRSSIREEYNLPGIFRQRFEDLLRDPDRDFTPSVIKVAGSDLHVLSGHSTASNPSELIAAGFTGAIERLKADYDAIVVDSAPMLSIADTLSIASHVTGTIVVVNLSKSDRREVGDAIGLLRRLNSRVIGVATTFASNASSGGYGYTYGSNRGRKV